MKHCKRLLILTLLLLLPLTATSAETVLASWTEDTPARLLCAGGRWYAMLGGLLPRYLWSGAGRHPLRQFDAERVHLRAGGIRL